MPLTSGQIGDLIHICGDLKGAVCVEQAVAVRQPGKEDYAVLVYEAEPPHYAFVLCGPHRHALSAIDHLRACAGEIGDLRLRIEVLGPGLRVCSRTDVWHVAEDSTWWSVVAGNDAESLGSRTWPEGQNSEQSLKNLGVDQTDRSVKHFKPARASAFNGTPRHAKLPLCLQSLVL